VRRGKLVDKLFLIFSLVLFNFCLFYVLHRPYQLSLIIVCVLFCCFFLQNFSYNIVGWTVLNNLLKFNKFREHNFTKPESRRRRVLCARLWNDWSRVYLLSSQIGDGPAESYQRPALCLFKLFSAGLTVSQRDEVA